LFVSLLRLDCQSDRGMSDTKSANNATAPIASISTYLPSSSPPSPKTTATQGITHSDAPIIWCTIRSYAIRSFISFGFSDHNKRQLHLKCLRKDKENVSNELHLCFHVACNWIPSIAIGLRRPRSFSIHPASPVGKREIGLYCFVLDLGVGCWMIDLEGGSLMMNSRRPIRTYSFIHGKYIDIRRRLKPEMVAHHPNLGPGLVGPD
jgi:hypothetical protein